MASTVVSQLKKALSVSKGKTIEEVLKTFNDSWGSIGGSGLFDVNEKTVPESAGWPEAAIPNGWAGPKGEYTPINTVVTHKGNIFFLKSIDVDHTGTMIYTWIHLSAAANSAQDVSNAAYDMAGSAQGMAEQALGNTDTCPLTIEAYVDFDSNLVKLSGPGTFKHVFDEMYYRHNDNVQHMHPLKLLIASVEYDEGTSLEGLIGVVDIDGAVFINSNITVYAHANLFIDPSGTATQNLFYTSGSGLPTDDFFLDLPSLS